jgi:hypothetical protein
MFRGWESDTCPFDTLSLKSTQWQEEEVGECVGLKPQLVAQIEFAESISDDLPRHSRFVALRHDKSRGIPTKCGKRARIVAVSGLCR